MKGNLPREEWESGPGIELGNEFAEVTIRKVRTRNGARLLITAPKSGHWITLCPLELEALTWQDHDSVSAILTNPYLPLEINESHAD